MAHRDREVNRPRRVKIERSLQAAEELARHVWQSWHTDYRGRMYTGNKFVTTGAKTTRSWLSFLPTNTNQDSQKLLLMAAAGHYGMSRKSWNERFTWGENRLYQMMAAADDPLNRLELWRDAADPWQFLQCCIGLRDTVREQRTGCLSGRPDHQRLRNPGGFTHGPLVSTICTEAPRMICTAVAAEVIKHLKHDQQFGAPTDRALASCGWGGVDRSLCKGPVLAAPYGGSWMSVADGLVDRLDQHYGYVPLEEYGYRVANPSKYMASVMWTELRALVDPVLEVKAWLRKCTKRMLPQGVPMEWIGPNGWPMKIADRQPSTTRIQTNLYGTKVTSMIQDQSWEAPLSATQANKGIGANLAHSFDAAFAHGVVGWCRNNKVPVVANHDCFAVQATHASNFHMTLLHKFSEMYRFDWLECIREQNELKTGISLPAPPYYGTLDVGKIGCNPYLFG